MNVYKKITAGPETLFSDVVEGTQGNRRDYIKELMQQADRDISNGVECVLWLKFEGAKCWALYSYVTGTDECHYMGAGE